MAYSTFGIHFKAMYKKLLLLSLPLILLSGFAPTAFEYATINQGYSLTFPRDHYAHPDFRTEWWYFNGFLETEGELRYAYHVAFFVRRTEVDYYQDWLPIRWLANPVHLAHFSLLDLSTGEVTRAQRRNRDSASLFGDAVASTKEVLVQNGDWRNSERDGSIAVHIEEPGLSFVLNLNETQAVVLHGEDGKFVKAEHAGAARGSYYYSRPRLIGRARLQINNETTTYYSSAWMDHEFGSYHLAPNQSGWNWFSLMLGDDSELVIYALKNKDGSLSEHSKVTLIDPSGRISSLASEEFVLEEIKSWRSPTTGAVYPTHWQFEIPKLELELSLSSIKSESEFESQESTMVTYWEGPVNVTGQKQTKQINGVGFQELTGNAMPLSELYR